MAYLTFVCNKVQLSVLLAVVKTPKYNCFCFEFYPLCECLANVLILLRCASIYVTLIFLCCAHELFFIFDCLVCNSQVSEL